MKRLESAPLTPLEILTRTNSELLAKRKRPAQPIKPSDDVERYYRVQLRSLVRAIAKAVADEVMPVVKAEKRQYTGDSALGRFVSVRPSQEVRARIAQQVAKAGITGAIAADDLHVTLFYAKEGIPGEDELRELGEKAYTAVPGGYTLLGTGRWKALVLELESPELQARFDEVRASGAVHGHAEYRAHLSLKYMPAAGDLEKIRRRPLDIDSLALSDERWEPIREHTGDSLAGLLYTADDDDLVEAPSGGWIGRLLDAIREVAERYTGQMFERQARRLAASTVSMAEAESTKAFLASVNRAVGVDLAPMLSQQGMAEYLDAAIADNFGLIKSVSGEYLDRVRNIVIGGVRNGNHPTSIARALQHQTGIADRRAKLIARDQVAKLTSQITERRQVQAGITHFRWITSNDERVTGRPGGKYANAKIKCHEIAKRDIGFGPGVYRWDRGASYAGETNLHPGRAHVACRCTASPVFEWQLPNR